MPTAEIRIGIASQYLTGPVHLLDNFAHDRATFSFACSPLPGTVRHDQQSRRLSLGDFCKDALSMGWAIKHEEYYWDAHTSVVFGNNVALFPLAPMMLHQDTASLPGCRVVPAGPVEIAVYHRELCRAYNRILDNPIRFEPRD